MSKFFITASRAPGLDDAEAMRRLGRAYTLILSFGARRGTVDQCEAAGAGEPSAAGDTSAAEPEDQ